ncbi:hypothetical protein GF343_01865 [Candidatus Woesearchaeota archaeon]|nr:hypothetical protein [Candidatus Woesearchaeota archaeon]
MDEIKKYDGQREFSVDTVYRKLTRGIDGVPNEEAVDGLLQGAEQMRKGIAQVIEKFYQTAEHKQAGVMADKAEQFEVLSGAVVSAGRQGDLDQYNIALQQVVDASIQCKESASKMKHIKNRGFQDYDAKRELADFLRDLEKAVDANYSGRRLLPGQ